jgi:hypothetical protein
MRPKKAIDYRSQFVDSHDCRCKPCQEMLLLDGDLDEDSHESEYLEIIGHLYQDSAELVQSANMVKEMTQTLKSKDEHIVELERRLRDAEAKANDLAHNDQQQNEQPQPSNTHNGQRESVADVGESASTSGIGTTSSTGMQDILYRVDSLRSALVEKTKEIEKDKFRVQCLEKECQLTKDKHDELVRHRQESVKKDRDLALKDDEIKSLNAQIEGLETDLSEIGSFMEQRVKGRKRPRTHD